MIPQVTLRCEATAAHEAVAPFRSTPERIVVALLALGLAASVVGYVSYQEALRSQLGEQQLFTANIIKSHTYYIAYATQIALIFAAGCLSLFSTNLRLLQRRYLLNFALLLAAATLMTLRGYSLADLLSTKLVDATGPAAFFISVAVFVGARRRNWDFLGRVMVALAVIFSTLTLWRMGSLQTFTRQEGVANLAGYLNALYWPAAWIALGESPRETWARLLRFVPMAIYAVGSLFTQTRLNVVMIFAFMILLAYLQYRRGAPQTVGWIVALAGCIWLALFAAVFLRDSHTFGTVERVSDAFSSRLDEDTRTDQLVSFAEEVRPSELVLGRGSFAKWDWGGTLWGGVDLGYVTLLFYGGLPLLLTYIITHVTPGIVMFDSHAGTLQLTAGAVVALWALRMWSSSYPVSGIEYYPILFCVGACISLDCRD